MYGTTVIILEILTPMLECLPCSFHAKISAFDKELANTTQQECQAHFDASFESSLGKGFEISDVPEVSSTRYLASKERNGSLKVPLPCGGADAVSFLIYASSTARLSRGVCDPAPEYGPK